MPKRVLIEGDDHYNRMTAMGRLAYVVAKVRASQPNLSHAKTLRAAIAVIDPSAKPDSCMQSDEDCDTEGFHDGPGSTQSEMAIATDPTGTHIVVGFNDFRGFTNPQSVSGFAYSDDGGLTFTDGGQLPNVSNGFIGGTLLPQVDGDPDVKYIPGGAGCQFIYSSIMVIGLPKAAAPNFTGSAETMSIHRSTDCGHTWAGPFEVVPATNPTGVLIGPNARDAADKEFLDVDPDTGRVIMSWSNFTASSVIPGGVEISTTYADHIMTDTPPVWSGRAVVNINSLTFDTGSVPRFAGNGSNNVYVAWATESYTTGFGNVKVVTSTNNGLFFGRPLTLAASDFFPADYIVGNDRIHSFPIMSVDKSPGVNKGNVYVVYASNNNGDGADIAFHKSTNGGGSFTPPVLLNARPGSDRSQWFPVVAVDSTTGRVNVMYDDQGIASSGDLMQMTWMYSDDGGVTFSKPNALTRPFHAGYGNDTSQPNLGDYNAGVAQHGQFYAAFANTPHIVGFNDGQPASSIGYPSFLGNLIGGGTASAPGFARATTARVALDLGAVTFTESGADGFIDPGDQVLLKFPLRNYVTNPANGPVSYTHVTATLSATTPGVTLVQANAAYPDIAPGATQSNPGAFVVNIAPTFVPGTKIEFSLFVSTTQGSTTLVFTQNTGTPAVTTIFSENFDTTTPGTLPAGWAPIHVGGTPAVPWTTSNTFCGTASNGLFHTNANDTTGSNRTRFERVSTPNIVVPANAQYITIDFDICYDTEDDPSFNVLAYDGADLRITDFTGGHFARANFSDALADTFTTGSLQGYPKHTPRNSNTNYFQDISLWAGFSNGFQHVSMRFYGIAGDTIQLRPDFTQDSGGICSDVRPGHTCGVILDNLVVNSVFSCPFIAISPATLPAVLSGTGINVQFTQSGAAGAVSFTETGRLPQGLNLSPTGLFSGAPTQRGSFPITVKGTDVNGCKGTTSFTLSVQ